MSKSEQTELLARALYEEACQEPWQHAGKLNQAAWKRRARALLPHLVRLGLLEPKR